MSMSYICKLEVFVFSFQKKGRCFEKAFFGLWLRWRMGWKRINKNGRYKCSKEGMEWDGTSKLSPGFLGLLLGGWTDVLVAPNEERMTPGFPNGWSLVLGPWSFQLMTCPNLLLALVPRLSSASNLVNKMVVLWWYYGTKLNRGSRLPRSYIT